MTVAEWIIAGCVAGTIALVGILGWTTITTRSACLRLGYPAFDVDATLTAYCIIRIDQTDVVVPLSEATQR